MLDLPDLLEPERIRCGCELKSKKRALQTLAELLGASLRGDPPQGADEGAGPEAGVGPDRPDAGRAAAERADPPAARSADGEAPAAVSDMDILDALISRERLGSTALGHGIALPHSRMRDLAEPLAALVTLKDGVDFESGDGEPVDVVLGLLVPEHCNDEHLKILATLARRFSDDALRETLRGCGDGDELLARIAALPKLH